MKPDTQLITGEKPQCNGKNMSKAHELNKAQWKTFENVEIDWTISRDNGSLPDEFIDHTSGYHKCEECRCEHPMGWETGHEGIGYCRVCEKRVGVRRAQKQLAKTFEAVEKTSAYQYTHANKYMEEIRAGTPKGKGMYDLSEEVLIMKSSIQELLSKISPEYDGELVVRLKEVIHMSQEKCLDKALTARLEMICNSIEIKLQAGLTESGKDGAVQASDVTRSKLLFEAIGCLTKLLSGNASLNDQLYCTKATAESFGNSLLRLANIMAPDLKWFEQFKRRASEIKLPDMN